MFMFTGEYHIKLRTYIRILKTTTVIKLCTPVTHAFGRKFVGLLDLLFKYFALTINQGGILVVMRDAIIEVNRSFVTFTENTQTKFRDFIFLR